MDKKLKPSEIVYPWYGKSQAELNKERSGIPLMTIVNRNAHERIEKIRTSKNYQNAFAQNAQSALKQPNISASGSKYGRFMVFNVAEQEEPSSEHSSVQQVGRFKISDAENELQSPDENKKKVGRFTISNSPKGGRRARFHSRKNLSRLNRHVRNTSRNGAHHGRSSRRYDIKRRTRRHFVAGF